MRIPDEVVKCAVFLGGDDGHGIHLRGTGFIVQVPLEEASDSAIRYVITNKHVIDGINRSTVDEAIFIRVNSVSGHANWVKTDFAKWKRHSVDIPYVDIAIYYWPNIPVLDVRPVPFAMFVTAEQVESAGIGIGDEVFTTGLFSSSSGEDRNAPVVRVGNVARVSDPEVLIATRFRPDPTEYYVESHLVELRSIRGFSGSPVFIHLGGVRQDPDTGKIRMLAHTQFLLWGEFKGSGQRERTPHLLKIP